jgi:hypothetical protein
LDLLAHSCTISVNHNQLQQLTINLQPNPSSLTAEDSLQTRSRSATLSVVQSQRQNYVMTDGQSASLSWSKAPIWGLRPDFYYCQTVAGLLMWGALSDDRTDLSFARVTVSSNKSAVCCQYVQFTFYVLLNGYAIYTRLMSVQAQYSRSCPIISSSCYNSSIIT